MEIPMGCLRPTNKFGAFITLFIEVILKLHLDPGRSYFRCTIIISQDCQKPQAMEPEPGSVGGRKVWWQFRSQHSEFSRFLLGGSTAFFVRRHRNLQEKNAHASMCRFF